MSGSAKAGTTAERHKCELRILASTVVRAPPKRASGELCFPLTQTYMDVGYSEAKVSWRKIAISLTIQLSHGKILTAVTLEPG
jgi:hypothetical protein